MHEIVTLQLGQQSNYLATHFWNTQESYFTYAEDEESPVSHDVHWRPGIGADGSETFMPRTVIYDLKGGFGTLKQTNALYELTDDSQAPDAASLWPGRTVIQKQDPIPASAYQQALDAGESPSRPLTTDTVRYWSDFNRVFYHPRSIVQLNEYELNSSIMPFERWDTGGELFSALDREHDLADRDLRPFVEEADQMQGIQVMATMDDAWGGFAARYVERLRDEYGKTAIWVWGGEGGVKGVNRDKRLLRLTNKAKSLTELYKHSTLLIPVALPSTQPPRLRTVLSLDTSSSWHTSALLSTAIESATLPSRMRDASRRDNLGHIADLLNVHGKQTVANLQMSFSAAEEVPRSEEVGDAPADGLRLDLDLRFRDDVEAGVGRRNGYAGRSPRVFSQILATRGDRATAADEEDNRTAEDPDHRWRGSRDAISKRYRSTLNYPLLDSFPQIYRDAQGDTLKDNIAVTTTLSTDTELSKKLRTLRSTVTRFIGLEDREVLSNDLAEMADEYHEGWSSGSDGGDDED